MSANYIVIFVLGVVLAITPFGFGFVFIFVILDGLTLALTALINIAAVVNSVQQGDFTYKETWWVILLQFVFCADVVVSFIWCRILKQKTAQQVWNMFQSGDDYDEENLYSPLATISLKW